MTPYEQGYYNVLEKLANITMNTKAPTPPQPPKPPKFPKLQKNLFNKKFKSGRTLNITPQFRPMGINVSGTF